MADAGSDAEFEEYGLWVKKRDHDQLLSFMFWKSYIVLGRDRISWYDQEETDAEKLRGEFDFTNLTQGAYAVERNADKTATLRTPQGFNDCDLSYSNRRDEKEQKKFDGFVKDLERAIEVGKYAYYSKRGDTEA
jgi:hypothetical protein